MRRRLVTLAVATTTLVAVAFLVPLFGLVATLADDRATRPAELTARSIAPVAGLVDVATLADVVAAASADLDGTISVVLPDGTVVGHQVEEDGVIASVRATATAGLVSDRDERRVLVPVVTADGVTVVDVRVSVDRRGVVLARLGLALLGVVLVAGATLLADRTGRSTTAAARRLEGTARRLSDGQLDARADVQQPPDLAAVGRALDTLAGRIDVLLDEQREQAADLSHGLRTPLTALRLDAEALPSSPGRQRILDDLAAMDGAIGDVIERARAPVRAGGGTGADVVAVVEDRVAFWQALAEDEGRTITVDARRPPASGEPPPVVLPPADLATALDIVLDNVFRHTPAGTGCRVSATVVDGVVLVAVEDDGHGFADGVDPFVRGHSGGGGTGLGLDIVRRLVESAGGGTVLAGSGSGPTARGARVELRLPTLAAWSGPVRRP